MSSKPLGRGSPLGGPSESKFVIALVIVCVILAAIAFALFAANQSQDKSLKDRQAELDALQVNMSHMSQNLTALRSNNTALSGQLATVRANYDTVSAQYRALQNQSNAVDARLETFLEDAPTIAYTYLITPKTISENETGSVVTIAAYNLGKADASITMTCTVKTGNVTSVNNQTFQSVMSLDKRMYSWEFGNGTEILNVWAGLTA